jgi:hypothetical protein
VNRPTSSRDRQYKGRSDDSVPINLTVSREAACCLRELVPSPRGHGRLVSKLILDYARTTFRQSLRDVVRSELRQELQPDVMKELRQELRRKLRSEVRRELVKEHSG